MSTIVLTAPSNAFTIHPHSNTNTNTHSNTNNPLSFLELMNSPPDHSLSWSTGTTPEVMGDAPPPFAGTLSLFGGMGGAVESPVFGVQEGYSCCSNAMEMGGGSAAGMEHGTEGEGSVAQRSGVAYLESPDSSQLPFSPPVLLHHSPPQDTMSITTTITSVVDGSTAKRSFDGHDESDRVHYQPKKARVAVEQVLDNDNGDVTPTPTTTATVVEDAGAIKAPTTTTPARVVVVTETAPPPPPRSPSPPRSHRPAVPSPLSPAPVEAPPTPPTASYSFAMPSPPPQPVRRRSRSSEIALLKFALDPWLRLTRTLDGGSTISKPAPVAAPVVRRSFNPATYPSAGNLRELRQGGGGSNRRAAASTGYGMGGFGGLPFSFGGCDAMVAPQQPKWNLVDA